MIKNCIAVKNDHYEIVEFLIKKKASVNERESQKFTALHMAVITNNIDIVKLLIDSDAEVNCVNFENMTPLK
jgi:ankyrin repeat protein